MDTIITSVSVLLADKHFWWTPPQCQCTGKQWYQQCNNYTHNTHGTHCTYNCSSTYSTTYQQQVGHQPINHPPHPSAGSLINQGTKLCNSSQVPPRKLSFQLRRRHTPDFPQVAKELRADCSHLLNKNCPL